MRAAPGVPRETMQFRTHLITSAAAALAVYPRQPQQAAALLLAGVLIDLDHLVVYALQSGDWSISGALRYDRYRHKRIRAGDTRPRYGPLRSWLHRPWLLLPIVWTGATRWPALRPLALGASLHLALDYTYWPGDLRARIAARGRCAQCGRARKLEIERLRRSGRLQRRVLCRACIRRASAEARLAEKWYTDRSTQGSGGRATP